MEEQKIKLSVARAVLSNPSILLLDEMTGGLDFEVERAVQEALDILMLGRLTIIIAQRLSLIRNADYIAVMEEGQLVEMGTHEEPLAIDGLFAELLRCEEAAKLPKRGDRYANVGDFALGFNSEDPPRHLLRLCAQEYADLVPELNKIVSAIQVFGENCSCRSIYEESSTRRIGSCPQVLEPSLSKGNRVMVFCNTLNSSGAVDHYLGENQISTVNYHGEVPAEQRVENLKKFKSEDGDCPTLVCTGLAARGLDLDVNHIDYLHHTGRTARMGAKANALASLLRRQVGAGSQLLVFAVRFAAVERLSGSGSCSLSAVVSEWQLTRCCCGRETELMHGQDMTWNS
ncbi:hypothetical protein IFM89_034114 [Coptis chinensis]|uniref:Helicase C-terminal domain-containing protein n=1 Tax=Coptis chinensis TaxID=261450 RepID=A0A835I7Y7_9MAGN|nr:hypothetical protein IFM89_034114 [Coptis chinensis]